MNKSIRKPSVAGQFYPKDKIELTKVIDGLLESVEPEKDINIKAVVVPHAGYVFSGETAAVAYEQIKDKNIHTVFILSNSHTSTFGGLAINPSDLWETPMGEVSLDRQTADKLVKEYNFIHYNKDVHATDHNIEVQLPFLQKVLKNGFTIVPISFGNTDLDINTVAKAISVNLGDDDLLVVSSDLSHYPVYEIAKELDIKTLGLIMEGDIGKLDEYVKKNELADVAETLCCGIDAIKTLMKIAEIRDWQIRKNLKYMNSGDSPYGERKKVVGYGALVFGVGNKLIDKETEILSEVNKSKLLEIAILTIREYVINGKVKEFDIKDKNLLRQAGAFVALHQGDKLRGCIGVILPGEEPLWQIVRNMAISAATDDPRFLPVKEDDLDDIKYEVSVLSTPTVIDDWKKIELGKHGVIIRNGFKSGVFLPQVANDTGWPLERFLEELCYSKAGLDKKCYMDKDTEILVFSAQVFGE